MRFVIDGGDNCAGSKYSDDATSGGKFFGSHASTTPNLFWTSRYLAGSGDNLPDVATASRFVLPRAETTAVKF